MAVAEHPQVSFTSGHKSGKSTISVVTALWWVFTKPRGRVVLTAPTNHQCRNILWKELIRLVRLSKVPFPEPSILPHNGLQFDDGREIIGFSTKEPERMAGISGANLLFICDEASGIEEGIFEAIFGNMAGGGHMLLCGNPTQPSGTFYDSLKNEKASKAWKPFQVSSRVIASEAHGIPGLATTDWCDRRLAQYGSESDPRYQVRVLGEYPDYGTSNVIPLYLIESSKTAWHDNKGDDPQLFLGVDPARFGDDQSAIAIRRGNKIFETHTVSGQSGDQLAKRVMKLVAQHRKPGEQDPIINVDVIGIGASCYDFLALEDRVDVRPITSSEIAGLEDDYRNVRVEMWFEFAEWLKNGGGIPPDGELESDLLMPLYFFDQKNRYQLESKKDIKKRLGRSPDRGDAAVLSTYEPVPRLVQVPKKQTAAIVSRMGPGRGF